MANSDCCKKGSLLPGEPRGIMDKDTGAYLAKSPTAANAGGSAVAIVLLTDAFGLPLKNSKLIADTLSERLECDVWIPDIFAGTPTYLARIVHADYNL